MKKISKLSPLICLPLLTTQALSVTENFLTYKIKPHDTLGGVLSGLAICPLWGRKKFVEKTIELNPETIKKNGDFVHIGRVIRLPVNYLPEHQDYEVSETREVNFLISNPASKCETSYVAPKNKPKEIKDESPLTPATPEKQSSSSDSYGSLKASTDFFYTSLDLTDVATKEKANINSRVNNGFEFAWEQYWDSKNKTFLYYRSEKHAYEAVGDKMPSQKYTLQGFGIGYQRSFTDRFDLRFTALSQERLFARSTSLVNLFLDRAMVNELAITPVYELYSKGPFKLYTDLGVSYLMSSKTSNYSIKSGNKLKAGLLLTQQIKDFKLFGRSYYGVENQDSSISQKTMKELGISAGLSWSFGKQ